MFIFATHYSTFLHVVNPLYSPGRAQLWRRLPLAQSFHRQPMGARRGAPGRNRAPISARAADGGQSGARLLFDGLLSLSTGSQLTTATFSVIRQQSHIWRQEEDAEKTPPITHTHKQQCAFPHFARHIWSPRRAPAVPGPCCCSCSPVKAHRVPRADLPGILLRDSKRLRKCLLRVQEPLPPG